MASYGELGPPYSSQLTILLVRPPLPATRSKLTVPKRALRTLLLLTMAPAALSPRYLPPLLHLANSYSSFRIQVEPSISEKLPWFPPHLLHPEIPAHCLSPPPEQQFSNFTGHRHHQRGLLKCSLRFSGSGLRPQNLHSQQVPR